MYTCLPTAVQDEPPPPAAAAARNTGRRLLACDAFPLYVKNTCSQLKIQVAVRAQLAKGMDADFCRNGATKAGDWCTRFWFALDPNQQATPFASLTNTVIYV